MATFKRFEEIESWRLARELANRIWEYSNKGTFRQDYGLKNQINRSAGSVMDNIAEGFGRGGNKEFIQFLCISRASNDEVRSQLYRAFDRKHLEEETFNQLFKESLKVGTKINNLIQYLRKSDFKGDKFKPN